MHDHRNSEEWGITPGYHDVGGEWHETPEETVTAVLAAMGAGEDPSAGPPGRGDDDPVLCVRRGEQPELSAGPWIIGTEDHATLAVPVVDGVARLPANLPLGYHRLRHAETGRSRLLVVSPGRCHLPPDLRTWGWAVQLYATRSTQSWGMGDLADLRRLAHWSKAQGAGMALLNPLHAAIPGSDQASPYYPSSRCFRNPIYLRVEEVPGAADSGVELQAAAEGGRALNAERLIDRLAVWKRKSAVLERIWERFAAAGGDPAFDRFRVEGGEALEGFATHCALSEHLDGVWPQWPEEYRRPEHPAVARFAADHAVRIGYHAWLQWHTERQLVEAGQGIDLMQDLAIGTDSAGADAWLWQDALALDMRVGAPPDDFNRQGQEWGLPPFDPWRLRLMDFEPYIRILRGGFRGAGGLRFDHVMGLFRLFWIPLGATPSQGVYIRYPHRELLDILALESHRAGAYVVGEDLGTVEDFVRQELAERAVLSYRLLWFESRPPNEFPRLALAAATTHDLPTVAGVWTGADLDEQRAIGLEPNEAGDRAIRDRLAQWIRARGDEPAAEVVAATYALLSEAPSMILTATLEDAVVVTDRPNIPGTVEERPNWSLALPVPLEELEQSDTAAAIAAALGRTDGDWPVNP